MERVRNSSVEPVFRERRTRPICAQIWSWNMDQGAGKDNTNGAGRNVKRKHGNEIATTGNITINN
jgi:hypothetical protein